MSKKALNRKHLEAIPLGRAAMCLDCQVIINSRNRVCPRCGGTRFGHLANWVKPLCAAEEFVTAA